jgi:hypothetical protein
MCFDDMYRLTTDRTKHGQPVPEDLYVEIGA